MFHRAFEFDLSGLRDSLSQEEAEFVLQTEFVIDFNLALGNRGEEFGEDGREIDHDAVSSVRTFRYLS